MDELKIEYLPVQSLETYSKNTRKHQAKDIDNIVKSIEKFGFSDPIGIWSDHNVIVEGHGRLAAAKKLGMKEVPVIRLDHMTDEQRRAYGIAHNATAELSEWDDDMLKLELDDLDLGDFDFDFDFDIDSGETSGGGEEDNYEVPEQLESRIKKGQIYQLGRHRLMCGDSTSAEDVEKLMDGKKANLLLTDPPYNVALGMESIEEAKRRKRRTDGLTIQNDKMGNEEYYKFLVDVFTNAYNSMEKGACFYVWFASTEFVNIESSLKEAGLETRQLLIWRKSSLIMGRQDYQWNHEPCLYGWKEGAAHLWTSDRKQTTVCDFDKPNRNEFHPTMKPIPLFDYQMKNNTKKGDIVLDLFGGSGTTIMACEQNERIGYLMEYDPKYADVIIDRWEKYTGQKAILL